MTGVVQGAGHLAGVGPLGLSFRYTVCPGELTKVVLTPLSGKVGVMLRGFMHFRLEDTRALSDTTVPISSYPGKIGRCILNGFRDDNAQKRWDYNSGLLGPPLPSPLQPHLRVGANGRVGGGRHRMLGFGDRDWSLNVTVVRGSPLGVMVPTLDNARDLFK